MLNRSWTHCRPSRSLGRVTTVNTNAPVDVMRDFVAVTTLPDGGGGLPTGSRVARLGTISFTRSGFARIRWDDGTTSDEWAADLAVRAVRPHA